MAKKTERWQGDDFCIDNPFAALSKSVDAKPQNAPVSSTSDAGPADAPKMPVVRSARIERAHRSGKTVTIVAFSGNPDKALLTAWLKKAKAALGCGGTIEDDCVVLQGDRTDRVRSL